jgi:hypothetical protein
MRIRRFASATLRQQQWGMGDVLYSSSRAFIDNMEGITVEPAPDGGVIATIISDDTVSSSKKIF